MKLYVSFYFQETFLLFYSEKNTNMLQRSVLHFLQKPYYRCKPPVLSKGTHNFLVSICKKNAPVSNKNEMRQFVYKNSYFKAFFGLWRNIEEKMNVKIMYSRDSRSGFRTKKKDDHHYFLSSARLGEPSKKKIVR